MFLGVLAAAASIGCATVTSAAEPKYEIETKEGAFEVRRYGARVVAQTNVAGDWDDASNEAFRRLAGYIFGKNSGRKKMAMTAPVGQAAKAQTDVASGTRIAMTAPVAQKRDGDAWTVTFTMPEGETLASLPRPDDDRVHLREVLPVRVATVRFSGRWTHANLDEHETALRAWVASRKLAVEGEPEVNRYDPPFKPWFLRRNEIWLRIEDGAATPGDVRAVAPSATPVLR